MAVARALYAFNGGQEGDLTFQEDDIIRILKKDESGWWEGQTDDGRRGDFPYNYVELVSPEEVSNIRETSRMVIEAKTKNKTAGDAVSKVKVVPIPKTPTFTIEATLARKKVQAKKSMSEFRVLDENIRSIYPNFDRPLPPMWADKVYVSEEASRKRAEVLKIYVQKLVGNEVAEYALVSWMNPKESFKTSNEVRQAVLNAQQTGAMNSNSRNSFQVAMMNVCPLARVEFDWLANDAVELTFLKGDIIAIRSKETPSKGWWEGEASDGSRGLFPSNHVILLNQNDARSVVMGEKVESSSGNMRRKPSTNGGNSANKPPKPGMASVKGAAPPSAATPSNRQRKTENNFSLPSLDAFDELLLEGFTMIENGKMFTPKPNADSPGEGCLVTLSYIAYAWDCQKQRIIEFAASDLADERYYVGPLKFVVGKGETIKALERAVQHLEVGQESRIIVRPDLGYGDVGNPPAVPPNCHLVYDVRLEAFEGAKLPGPPPMISSGTSGNGSSSNLARSNGGSKTHRNPNPNGNGASNGSKFTPPMSPMPVSPVPGVMSPKASSYVPVGAVATPITKLNPPMPPQMGMMSPSNMQAVIGMSPGLGNRSLVEAVAARNIEQQNPYSSQAPIGSRKARPAPEVQKAGKKERKNKKNNSPRPPPPQENLPKYGLNEMKEIVANKSFSEARVDAEFLEDQLTDESFMTAFQMERKEFLMLPKWKQQKMKRGAGLY